MRKTLTACLTCTLLLAGTAFASTAGDARSSITSLLLGAPSVGVASSSNKSFVAPAALQEVAAQATVFTDKPDYAPGEVVTITGSNWAPNEVVTLTLHKERGEEKFDDILLSAISDDKGDIRNDSYAPNEGDLGVSYTLTAKGEGSGRGAMTSFTDGPAPAPPCSASISGPPSPVPAGTSITLSSSANNTGGGALSYQWYITSAANLAGVNFGVNTNPIPGATSSTLNRTITGTTKFLLVINNSTGCSNVVSNILTYNVLTDTTPPVVTVPANMTAEATGPSGAAVTYTATANDNVNGALTPSCSPASGSTFALGSTTVNCSATDAAGNTGSASFSVTVQDTTAPSISGNPGNQSAEATGPSGAAVSWVAPTATDLVDGSVAVNCSPASGSTFAIGTTAVNCSAADTHSNSAQINFNVTVSDSTAPSLSLPGSLSAEATGPSGAAVSYSASASDIVDGSVTPSCSPASGSTFALGSTTVNCSATDAHGNTATGSFSVSVIDTTPPSISNVPADITAEATSGSGAAVTYTNPTASDIVDGSVAVNCSPASGSTFPIGTTAVNCSASDAAGNNSSASFNVKVQDTTAPSVNVPANIVAEATGAGGAAVTYSATASDIVDGTLTPSCSPASGSTFGITTTTVNCSATDAAGNTGSASFTVKVQDTTAPSLSLPANITGVEATGPSGAVVAYSASASDIVDGSVTPSCSPASGSAFGVATTTVNCSATDAHGNSASGSFTVTVVDTTKPTLNLPANIVTAATGNSSAVVTYSATASDIVDGAITPSCSPASGSTFSLGTTTVNCSATDSHGNTRAGSFTVTVNFNLNGFFKPIDMYPIVNKAKAGSAIPVKFSLSGYQGQNIFAAGYPGSAPIACDAGSPVDAVTETVNAGGSSLNYDASLDQYVYVWKTDSKWAGTCRQLQVKFADGSVRWANFTFTK